MYEAILTLEDGRTFHLVQPTYEALLSQLEATYRLVGAKQVASTLFRVGDRVVNHLTDIEQGDTLAP